MLREQRSFEPPARFAAAARLKPSDVEQLRRRAAADYTGFWADLARAHLHWHRPFTQVLDESAAPNYRWFSDGELNVCHNCLDVQPRAARRQARADIRGRAGRYAHAQLSRAARAGLPLRQCAQGSRRAPRRSHRHLHADDSGDHRRDAGMRAHRRHPLGRVRRLFGRVAARSHRRRGRNAGDHGRWRLARRSIGAAQGRGRPGINLRLSDSRQRRGRAPYRRCHHHAGPARPLVARAHRHVRRPTASRNGSMPSIRCICCTPPVPPASPRAFSTRAPAIC